MNHYLGLDPYVIKERNEEIRREVRALRLEGRLRQDQRQTPSRLVVFALRSTLPLLRRAVDPYREGEGGKRIREILTR